MRIPLAPPGYRVDSVRDKSWDEHRRTKAVAVTFRTAMGEPLVVLYRLEPEWVFESADEVGSVRCLNLLRFYPWSAPGWPGDTLLQADLTQEATVANALRIDSEPANSRRYVAHGVVVDMIFLAGLSVGIARPAGAALPDLQTEPYESLRPELPAEDSGEYRGYLKERPGGNFYDHEPLSIEIRNEEGELVEPPDGVTYSGSYEVPDTAPSDFDAAGSYSCVFCASPDWRWILQMKPTAPRAPLAWPEYLVSCDPCQQLRHAHQLDALRERIMAGSGKDYPIEYFDELLDQIELVKPRS